MVNWFHADAVALCHCFIPVLLRHLQPAIRRQLLEMTKSIGGGVIRDALSRSGPSRPSAVNTDEWRALSSHFG